MSIFDFFTNRKKGPSKKDFIYISKAAKYQGLLDLIKDKNPTVVTWFNKSKTDLEEFLNGKGFSNDVKLAKNFTVSASSKLIVFTEHFPLASKEDHFLTRLGNKEIIFLSSLDEPFFQKFGGEKIIVLMKQLGMKDNEHMEHTMISKSIRNAQEKIEGKVSTELLADSQEEWFKKNYRKEQ